MSKKSVCSFIVTFLFLVICRTNVFADTTYNLNVENGQDIATKLDNAIMEASLQAEADNCINTVKIPEGNYNIGKTIHLRSNVCIDARGAVLNYTKTKANMLMSGTTPINQSSKESGYGSIRNIKIIGGIWKGNAKCSSTIIRMSHLTNVTMKECVVVGGKCPHQMEVCAINGLTIDGCTFKDMGYKSSDDGKAEAVQFDLPVTDYVFNGVVLDGTPMKNVSVKNCKFENVPRGVGSHTMLAGCYHTNMEFVNNQFKNVTEECIVALNYKDCLIKNNEIKDCGAGILVQNMKSSLRAVYSTINNGKTKYKGKLYTDLNTIIENNTITLKKRSNSDSIFGIKTYGRELKKNTKATGKATGNVIPKGKYYCGGVTIRNNKIVTSGRGIHLMYGKDTVLEGNSIKYNGKSKKYDGIFVEQASKNIKIIDNTISNSKRYGIAIIKKSSASVITGNVVKNTAENGIHVYESTVTKAINNNTVSASKAKGINVGLKSKAGLVYGNTVKNCKDWAICVDRNAVAVVGSNTLQKNKKNVIFVIAKGTIAQTVKMSAGVSKLSVDTKGTVKWKKTKNAKGYIVQYSTDSKFKDANMITVAASKNSCKIKSLKAGNTYYVRVCSYEMLNGIKVCSKFSGGKKIVL